MFLFYVTFFWRGGGGGNNKTTVVLSFERSLISLVGHKCPVNQELFLCSFTLLRRFIFMSALEQFSCRHGNVKCLFRLHTLNHWCAFCHLLASYVDFKLESNVTVSVGNIVSYL